MMGFKIYLVQQFQKSLTIFLGLFLILSVSFQSFSAVDDEEEDVEVKATSKNYLTLTLGVEHDEKISSMPSYIRFKGDFKKIVEPTFLKDLGVIRFVPKREGTANLTIHNSKGIKIGQFHLRVRKSNLDSVLREIKFLLGDIEGINFRIVNNKVLVDGQILLPRDMNRIYVVVSQYGDQATSIVTLSPLAQKKIAEFIARDINNPDIEVRAVNDKFILQGTVASEDDKNRAEIIAQTYVPDEIVDKSVADGVIKKRKATIIINLLVVKPAGPPPPAKTVQLVFHYVELQKDYSKAFRFQFTPNLQDGSQLRFQTGDNTGGVTSSITGVIDNLLPKLNWAKQHGYARVLESSTLLVEEGREGILNSFQEIPFTTASGNLGSPVTSFKKVGLQSKVTPVILGERSDSIKLVMSFELSAVVGSTQAGPLTSNNEISTGLTIRSGNSAAVGGLITNRSVTGFNKLPAGAAQNPIISLYNSKDFQKNQSQFVVFVTPIIKASASSGSEKIKKKFRLGQ